MPHKIAHKFKQQKRTHLLKKLLLISILVIVVFGALFYSTNKALKVTGIDVSGNERIATEDVRDFAKEILNGGALSFWIKENIIFFGAKNMSDALKKQFSAINQVEVSRNFLKRSIEIKIEERSSWAVWCQIAEESSKKCFYMDDEGIIFRRSPKFLGGLVLKVKDERTEEFKLGDEVIEKVVFKKLQDFIDMIKIDRGLSIKEIQISPELKIELLSSAGFKIIVDAETNFKRASENLTLFLNTISEKRLSSIEYVDFRFEDRAFYK